MQDYKSRFEATQLENEKHLNNGKINVQVIIENHKEFIKNNKIILRSWQRFKSQTHSVFIEAINKMALSLCNDKIIQSIDSIETYTYGAKNDLTY